MSSARTASRRTRNPAKKPPAATPATAAPARPMPPTGIPPEASAQTSAATSVRPFADPRLAHAADRAADILGLAEDQALAVLERAAEQAGRDLATAAQWAGEAERLRADAVVEAETVTQSAEQTARKILARATDEAARIRQDAAKEARKLREEADAHAHAAADQLLENATERAGALLTDAGQRAATVRAEAGQEAKRLIALADQHAAKTVEEAEHETEAVRRRSAADLADVQAQVSDARQELERTRTRTAADRAQGEDDLTRVRELAATVQRNAASAAERTLTEAATAAEQIRTRAAAAAREIVQAAEEQAVQTRTEAEETAGRVTEAALAEADTVREDAQTAADQLREQAAAEAEELREDGAQQAADLRERGRQAVQRLREDAQTAIDEAKHAVGEELRKAGSVRGKAEAAGERLLNVARLEAEKITSEALAELAETEQHVAELRAEQEQLEQRRADRQKSRIRRAWRRLESSIPKLLPKVALWAGVTYTAAGEHHLAVMAGVDSTLAWLFPVAVDVWVVAATRAHAKAHSKEERERITWEVVTALLVMTACQIAALLAELHIVGVEQRDGAWRVQWGLAIPLAMVVPVVIWRVHALMGHGTDAHHAPAAAAAGDGALTGQPGGAHEDPTPRPPYGGQPLDTAYGALLPAQSVHPARSYERAIVAGGGTSDAHHALPPASLVSADAHQAPALSDAALMYGRKALVRSLYDALGRRPRVAEIHAALSAKGLLTGDENRTRSTCQRVRSAVEADEPALKPAVRSA